MAHNSFDNYFLSWKPDKKLLTRPLYLALANLLEADIASGKLAPGTQLPPQRELADYLGINF
ncbi:MAG: GntR family transcriptional regulator, partial [Lentisphaeria bacterium]|nr:GntR family transcriptional regulator [Lentisphaeria bacterium]